MPKIYSKANVQNNNPATPVSAGTMAIFDNGIDGVDTKTQNLPEDGSFDPSLKANLTYVNTELNKKVDKESGKSLMLNSDKLKLDGIQAGAQVNEVSSAQLDTKVDKLMATNIVTNGDFSNGTTGWVANSGTNISVTNGVLVSTNQNNFGSIRFFQDTTPYVAGNKLYLRTLATAKGEVSTDLAFRILGSITTGTIINAQTIVPVLNVQNVLSGVVTIPSDGAGLVRVDVRALYSTSTVGKIIECDNVLAINLTTLFGAGNEPTKEQMDYLLSNFPNSWFNGTQELMNYKQLLDYAIDLDNAKANRTQEAWITPTLLNGWTGNIRYIKDQFGFVHFSGSVSGGTAGTTAFVLPTGYRPTVTEQFACVVNSTAFANVQIITTGSFNVFGTSSPNGTFVGAIKFRT